MSDKLLKQLKRHEGFRSKVYKCSAGKRTVGYGRNLDDTGVTRQEAESMLDSDINNASRELIKSLPWLNWRIKDARYDVLINMCLNMGINRFLGFKKMLTAFELKDYKEASSQMLDSRWATQVGYRAIELAEQMTTGQYKKVGR